MLKVCWSLDFPFVVDGVMDERYEVDIVVIYDKQVVLLSPAFFPLLWMRKNVERIYVLENFREKSNLLDFEG